MSFFAGTRSRVTGRSNSTGAPSPHFSAYWYHVSTPILSAICAKSTFELSANAPAGSCVPVPSSSSLWTVKLPTVKPPASLNVDCGVTTPASSASDAVTILNVEPGGYSPPVERSSSGEAGSCASDAQCASSWFGSYDGTEASAITAPL